MGQFAVLQAVIFLSFCSFSSGFFTFSTGYRWQCQGKNTACLSCSTEAGDGSPCKPGYFKYTTERLCSELCQSVPAMKWECTMGEDMCQPCVVNAEHLVGSMPACRSSSPAYQFDTFEHCQAFTTCGSPSRTICSREHKICLDCRIPSANCNQISPTEQYYTFARCEMNCQDFAIPVSVPIGGSTTNTSGILGGITTTTNTIRLGGASSTTALLGGASTTAPLGGASTTGPLGGASTTAPLGGSSTTGPLGGSSTTGPLDGTSTTSPPLGGPSTTGPPIGGPSTTGPPLGGPSTTGPPLGAASSTTGPPPLGGISSTTGPPLGGASSTTGPPLGGASSTTAPPLGGASSTSGPLSGGASSTSGPLGGASSTTGPLGGSTTTSSTTSGASDSLAVTSGTFVPTGVATTLSGYHEATKSNAILSGGVPITTATSVQPTEAHSWSGHMNMTTGASVQPTEAHSWSGHMNMTTGADSNGSPSPTPESSTVLVEENWNNGMHRVAIPIKPVLACHRYSGRCKMCGLEVGIMCPFGEDLFPMEDKNTCQDGCSKESRCH